MQKLIPRYRLEHGALTALMVPPQVIPSEPDGGRHSETYRAAAAPMKERTSMPPIGTGTTIA